MKWRPKGSVPDKDTKTKVTVSRVDRSIDFARLVLDTVEASGFEMHLGSLDFDLKVLYPMIQHLNSLEGSLSERSVTLRRQGLRDFSTEQLQEFARQSSPLDWSARPSYYRALAEEIQSRARQVQKDPPDE